MIRVLLRPALIFGLISAAFVQFALIGGYRLPGDVIAYLQKQKFNSNSDVYALDLRTLTAINLTHSPQTLKFYPVWSPDGSQIAYFRQSDAANDPSICIVSGKARCYPAGTNAITELRWSPDGSRIVYSDSDFVFYTLDLESDAPPGSSQPGIFPTYWSWSPDGAQLVFTTDTGRSGVTACCAIYLANGDFSNLHLIYQGSLHINTSPSWSPDGKQLLFGAREGTSPPHLYLLDTADAKIRTLSEFPDEDPGWSPDGTQIAFTSDRSGSEELYLMRADGTSQRIVSEVGRWRDLQYVWSPDGSRILLVGAQTGGSGQLFILDLRSRLIEHIPSDGRRTAFSWRP